MIESHKYKFEPGAMSIIQMGEELIGHPSTAINELVKNGYDADAGKCYVYTQYDQDPDKTFIIIKDDGLGMSEDVLFGNWLKPSISSKRDEDLANRRSAVYNRRYLGSKGIGRLAAMALGQQLTVITKTNSDINYNWIKIDREIFRVESLLDRIDFPGGTIPDYRDLFNDKEFLESVDQRRNGNLVHLLNNTPFGNFREGTLIIVQNLDDSIRTIVEEEFDFKEIEDTSVFKSLRDLITPLKLNSDIQKELLAKRIIRQELMIDNGEGTFELFYGINFIKEQVKGSDEFFPVEPSTILEHYDYRTFGKVLDTEKLTEDDYLIDGRYICRRFDDDLKDEELKLESQFVLSDEDLPIRRIKELEVPTKYQEVDVGEFYFDIRVYDLDPDAKNKIATLLNADGRREGMRTFNKYLGLKISKNGFGVKPYGEEEQDWLGLGAKRVQKHEVTIGPNQIIGYVFLYSPQNDGLSEKTNREGFFENKAFIVFKKIVSGILEEIGRRRAKYRELHGLGRKINSRHDRPDTEKFIQYILNSTDNADLIHKTRQFVDETNDVLDNMEYSLTFSQRLATLGTGLELVYHELSQPLTSLGATKSSLLINAKKIQDEELREVMLSRLENMELSLELLDTIKESLQPAIGKTVAKLFRPLTTFKKVCSLFESLFVEQGIILEIQKSTENFEAKAQEYVFWISFLNIINNAVYWLKFADDKKVIIFESPSADTLVISNTGPKIPDDELEIIFGYGITSKKERNSTGLGLAFTRNMLTTNKYEIWAENRSYGPAFFIKKTE